MTAQGSRAGQYRNHWERIYARKRARELSWYQPHAAISLRLIQQSGVGKRAAIIDVGGGASPLVDDLLREGYTNLTVLDLSPTALAASRQRLGRDAGRVRWLEADITRVELPEQAYELWHDRAVFHFLTQPGERAAYISALVRAVKTAGHVIVATFSESGPEQCSGLPVVRYRPETLQSELGGAFVLLGHVNERHLTPAGLVQPFLYCHFQKRESGSA